MSTCRAASWNKNKIYHLIIRLSLLNIAMSVSKCFLRDVDIKQGILDQLHKTITRAIKYSLFISYFLKLKKNKEKNN